MWYGWDTDGFVIGCDSKNNYEDFVAFKTKKDLIQQISFQYEDGRKRLDVRKVAPGYYVYYPKDCDGNYREPYDIIDENCIDKYKKRELFNDLMKEFLNSST